MKKILLLLLMSAFCCIPVYAHPGKTDAQGGHYDNETGEYHYHHGYPAHEHVNGECPYDFDDQTGVNSGTSSVSTVTPKPELHLETPDPLSPPLTKYLEYNRGLIYRNTAYAASSDLGSETTKNNTGSSGKNIFWYFIISIVALIIITSIISHYIEKLVEKRRKYEEKLNYLDNLAKKLKKQEWEKLLSNIKSKCPNGYSIDMNELPYKINNTYHWGEEFTVYITKKGHCFHRIYCKALIGKGKTVIAVHRYDAIKQGYIACHYCTPNDKIDDWYTKILPASPYAKLNKSPAPSNTEQ